MISFTCLHIMLRVCRAEGWRAYLVTEGPQMGWLARLAAQVGPGRRWSEKLREMAGREVARHWRRATGFQRRWWNRPGIEAFGFRAQMPPTVPPTQHSLHSDKENDEGCSQ